ncbi:acyltransferase family protein [Methylobacterium sp. JK268]
MSDTTRAGRQRHLDGLRAVAVLLVLFAHCPVPPGGGPVESLWTALRATRPAYIGVAIFFVLSGFLITRILIDERSRAGHIDIAAFAIKRAFRIFPIYYLCILFLSIVHAMSAGQLLSSATYTINYYHPLHPDPFPLEHGWSLAVEEQFYLLWPFAIARIPLGYGRLFTGLIVPCGSLAAALGLAAALDPDLAGAFIYKSLPTQAMPLAAGAFLAFLAHEGRSLPFATCIGAAGLGAAILAADLLGRAAGLVPAGGAYWCAALVGYALLGFGAVAALTVSRPPRRLVAALSWRPLVYVGRISYGVYLYHVIVLYMLGINEAAVSPGSVPYGTILLAVALTGAIAIASYELVERPLLRWRRLVLPRPALREAAHAP